MKGSQRRLMALVLMIPITVNACFTYSAAAPAESIRPATPVRLQLSRPEDFRLTNLAAIDVVTVDGEAIRVGEDSVLVSAKWLRARSGYEFVGSGETIRVPRVQVVSIQTKRLSKARTALAAGALFALTATIGAAVGAIGGNGGEGGDRDGGGQTQ